MFGYELWLNMIQDRSAQMDSRWIVSSWIANLNLAMAKAAVILIHCGESMWNKRTQMKPILFVAFARWLRAPVALERLLVQSWCVSVVCRWCVCVRVCVGVWVSVCVYACACVCACVYVYATPNESQEKLNQCLCGSAGRPGGTTTSNKFRCIGAKRPPWAGSAAARAQRCSNSSVGPPASLSRNVLAVLFRSRVAFDLCVCVRRRRRWPTQRWARR